MNSPLSGLIIVLIFILIIFLIIVRLYYLLDKPNDKLNNITTIIPFSKFSENCPSRSIDKYDDQINYVCWEYPKMFTQIRECTQDNCSNYYFYKISQANK
jgi:hypothetical protein